MIYKPEFDFKTRHSRKMGSTFLRRGHCVPAGNRRESHQRVKEIPRTGRLIFSVLLGIFGQKLQE